MNPILTPVERLIIENQTAMLDALAVICALLPNAEGGISHFNDKREVSRMLHALAEDSRFVLEKSK